MKTKDIIEGLAILEKYRDEKDVYNTGAEHDELFAYATDRPLGNGDLARMVELGWIQSESMLWNEENVTEEGGGDFEVRHYDPDEAWNCFV